MLKSGDHLLFASDIYSGTTEIFRELKNINVECDAVDFDDLENVKKAMKSNTRVFNISVVFSTGEEVTCVLFFRSFGLSHQLIRC